MEQALILNKAFERDINDYKDYRMSQDEVKFSLKF